MTAAGEKRHGAPARGLSAREVVATAAEAAGDGKVTVGQLIDAFGRRAVGTLLFFLGAIMLTPVGAIPGAPLVTTVLVVLLMGQSVVRKGAPWLPAWIRDAEIDSARLRAGLQRIEPWADRMDRVTRPRLTALFDPSLTIGWSIGCIAIALSMIPLGLIPFAAAVPSLSLALIGLGMINLDGAAAALGAAVALVGGWLVLTTLTAVPV